MNITVFELQQLAEEYDRDLINFRLTGNVEHLVGFVAAAVTIAQPKENDSRLSEFKDNLTDNEYSALYHIRKEIGVEGNISVVKMIQKTNHSRPVFTSLLAKLEKYSVAEVKNQGVKGTYIKFLYDLGEN